MTIAVSDNRITVRNIDHQLSHLLCLGTPAAIIKLMDELDNEEIIIVRSKSEEVNINLDYLPAAQKKAIVLQGTAEIIHNSNRYFIASGQIATINSCLQCSIKLKPNTVFVYWFM